MNPQINVTDPDLSGPGQEGLAIKFQNLKGKTEEVHLHIIPNLIYVIHPFILIRG